MLRRLEIRGLVVIEHADLEFGPGLTAITGETGAGKTVLTQALALLGGAAAEPGMVRPGHTHALVQATLILPPGFWDRLEADSQALGIRDLVEDETEIVVTRRIPARGRARCFIDGQSVSTDALASLVGRNLRCVAQGDQRRAVTPHAQLSLLDRFIGFRAIEAARLLDRLRRDLQAKTRQLAATEERHHANFRHRHSLEQLVEDVSSLGPSQTDLASLQIERDRLRGRTLIGSAVASAAEALSPESGDGAITLTGLAERAAADAARLDPALGEAAANILAAQTLLQDAALTLRGYIESLDADPRRLEFVEDRLAEYAKIERRHGPGLDQVLAAADSAKRDLAEIDDGEPILVQLRAELDSQISASAILASELHSVRQGAAAQLEESVSSTLAELAMPAARVRVAISLCEDTVPPRDECQFWVCLNPGLREAPLARVASGGELSRFLLAILSVASASDEATWVFDEIDAGIGGVTASVVAKHLAVLGEQHQTIVVTHLPQIAAVAKAHYSLVKSVDDTGATVTRIQALGPLGLVNELTRMLGSHEDDRAARTHAAELVRKGKASSNL